MWDALLQEFIKETKNIELQQKIQMLVLQPLINYIIQSFAMYFIILVSLLATIIFLLIVLIVKYYCGQ